MDLAGLKRVSGKSLDREFRALRLSQADSAGSLGYREDSRRPLMRLQSDTHNPE
jgi:hypothetical protein